MAFPVSGAPYGTGAATPNPAYSGTFIPEIWSGKLIEKFYSATVLASIANTDYEGEIKSQGDKVHIRTKPTVTINDYSADQDLNIERPGSSIVDLTIDKGKYFNTILDDVMDVQSDVNQMSLWSDDASEQMKIKIDTDVLTNVSTGVSAVNKGAAAGKISGNLNLGTSAASVVLTAANVVNFIISMGLVLDEQNIPEQGRWVVLPAWVVALLKQSDLKAVYITGDDTSPLRNGRVGGIDRFTLFNSNLLPIAAGKTTMLAGHKHGLTFASQVTKVETLRSERTFGTILRGLQVYGYKVLDGTALVSAVVSPS